MHERRFGGEAIVAAYNSLRNRSQDARNSEKYLSKILDETLLTPTPPTQRTLDGTSTEDLILALQRIRDPNGHSINGQEFDRHKRIIQFLEHLIKTRDLPLDIFAYECMMDAMIDPQGSAEGIRALFKKMEQEGIIPSGTICRSALAALAVHPNYVLRQQVLDTMKDHWFQMDATADQSIMIGMLRDGQYELAYDKLMEKVEGGERIELWVYDVFIMVFGHQGFLDEMLQLLYRRKDAKGSDPVAMSLTYYVLDLCSSASHYQGTAFAWNSVVRNGQLNPSDGILENVLATAAREGDVDLATEVHGKISNRSRVQIHHYDALIEAFSRDRNIAGALRILLIMEQSGLAAFRENTRAVYEALCQDENLVRRAEEALREMATDERVPLGAIGVVLEAKAKLLDSEAAMDLYDDVRRLSGRDASASMIQDMIINSQNSINTRKFLDDYRKISIHENPPARLPGPSSKLIFACLGSNDLDLALRFAIQALRSHPSKTEAPAWLRMLTEEAITAEDGRIWEIFDTFKKAGNAQAVSTMQRMSRLMQMAKRMQDKKQQQGGKATVTDTILDQLGAKRRQT